MQITDTGLNHREHREPGISGSDSSVTSVSSVVRNSEFDIPNSALTKGEPDES